MTLCPGALHLAPSETLTRPPSDALTLLSPPDSRTLAVGDLCLFSESQLVPPAKQLACFPNATILYDHPGDGSCQFAAMAHQLNLAGIPDNAASVRK